MKETLVSSEIAKLAYEKGFNLNDKGYYVPMYCVDGELIKEKLGYQKELPETFEKGFIIAPTQSLLQKWLREIHSIHVCVDISLLKEWYVNIYNIKNKPSEFGQTYEVLNEVRLKTYEEALEIGLQEGLKLI